MMIVCSLKGFSLKCIRLKVYVEQTLVQLLLRCLLSVCIVDTTCCRQYDYTIHVRSSVGVAMVAVYCDDTTSPFVYFRVI
jgi:hypothetical protein